MVAVLMCGMLTSSTLVVFVWATLAKKFCLLYTAGFPVHVRTVFNNVQGNPNVAEKVRVRIRKLYIFFVSTT